MTEWYYVDNLRQRQGPVPQEALVKLHRSGALNDASLAWREGMGQWTPLGELGSELGLAAPAPIAAPPTPEPAAEPVKAEEQPAEKAEAPAPAAEAAPAEEPKEAAPAEEANV